MVYHFIISKTLGIVCVVIELALVLWQWVFCCGVLPDHNHVLKCSMLIPCRGKGDYFRLGHGSDVHVRKPQVVEGLRGKKIVHVAVGALHCLAVTDAGQVRELVTRSYVDSVTWQNEVSLGTWKTRRVGYVCCVPVYICLTVSMSYKVVSFPTVMSNREMYVFHFRTEVILDKSLLLHHKRLSCDRLIDDIIWNSFMTANQHIVLQSEWNKKELYFLILESTKFLEKWTYFFGSFSLWKIKDKMLQYLVEEENFLLLRTVYRWIHWVDIK